MSSSASASPKPKTSTYENDQSKIAANNRGPITSLLALPASCTQTLTYISSYYFGHYGSVFDPACVATGTLDYEKIAPGDSWKKYYYSPAICPQGWTIAATFSKCFEVVPVNNCLSLGPETSAGLCCPSGYTSHRSGHQCASTITLGQSVTFIRPTQAPGEVGWDTGTPTTNEERETALVKGDGIPVWWQKTDEAMLSSAAAGTPSSVPAQTSRTSGGLIFEPTDSSAALSAPETSNTGGVGLSESTESSGLSTGAKAGIGVGVAVGVVVLGLVMGFFLWRRRRNQSKNVAAPPPVLMGDVYPDSAPPPVYAHDRQKTEPVYRQEMQGDDTRYELPGTLHK